MPEDILDRLEKYATHWSKTLDDPWAMNATLALIEVARRARKLDDYCRTQKLDDALDALKELDR